MAGGVGSRFWPFSTTKRPKQFLDLFGTGRSLLQMTFDRFSKIVPVEHIFIASNLSYKGTDIAATARNKAFAAAAGARPPQYGPLYSVCHQQNHVDR